MICHLPVSASEPREWGVGWHRGWGVAVIFCLVHSCEPVGCVDNGDITGAEWADLGVNSEGPVTC